MPKLAIFLNVCLVNPQGVPGGVPLAWVGRASKVSGLDGHTFGLDWGTLNGSKRDFSKFDPTGQKSTVSG